METIFSDFINNETATEDVIFKYKEKLPEELIVTWKKYGFGTLINGFLKVINPNDYSDILERSYVRNEQAIPMFTTAMGDIIVWEKDKYVNLLNFRKGYVNVISSGFEFFFDDLQDKDFMNEELMWEPYPEAISKYSPPNYDECFGYTPLLGLGGTEKVENLKKVKLKEHILIITEFLGPIK
ncbi:T6SS immunity protein Tdi1 domain-containing protein [Virgibacillus halodenitrificans]|uniref:T6SS immunity protein Tdi1 domain-containing protein n=1 Tax=Virgibacillus halodenitrificans TaxID=1482 RepID=UPI000EF49284|nr:T6SS immunity protein Tdi1 domain-containing protein [Virgibacillus halodenitrificans]